MLHTHGCDTATSQNLNLSEHTLTWNKYFVWISNITDNNCLVFIFHVKCVNQIKQLVKIPSLFYIKKWYKAGAVSFSSNHSSLQQLNFILDAQFVKKTSHCYHSLFMYLPVWLVVLCCILLPFTPFRAIVGITVPALPLFIFFLFSSTVQYKIRGSFFPCVAMKYHWNIGNVLLVEGNVCWCLPAVCWLRA